MVVPALSSYCITKFGVEAFSDCLRYEMQPLGVKVSVVEPSNYVIATSFGSPQRIQAIANKMWDELPEVVRKDYGKKYFDEKITVMETYCTQGFTDTSPRHQRCHPRPDCCHPLHPLLPHGLLLVAANADRDPLAWGNLLQDGHTLKSFGDLASFESPGGQEGGEESWRGRREGRICIVAS